MGYGNGGGQAISGGALPAGIGTATRTAGPTVHECLSQQEQRIAEAHTLIDQLTERVSTLLGPEPNMDKAMTAPPAPQSTQVTSRIDLNTRGVQLVSRRLADLIQRLEI